MKYRNRLIITGLSSLAFIAWFAGCGDYSDPGSTSGTMNTSGPTSTATTTNTTGPGTSTATTGGTTTGTTSSTTTTGTSGTDGAGGAGGATSTTGTSTTGAIDASCDNVTACGGDILGTWAVAGSCIEISGMTDMTGFGLGCTEAPVMGELEIGGTFTANADGTVADNTTTTGQMVIELSYECLDVSGTVTTCDRVGAPLSAIGFESVECLDNEETEGCTCTGVVNQSGGMSFVSFDASDSGEVATGAMSFTISGRGEDVEYGYCVADNVMTVTPLTANKTGAMTGSIALIKQ